MGQLLGVKIVSSEFIAFIQLADLKNINNSIELLSKKSITMATFMLCGFANLTSTEFKSEELSFSPSTKKIYLNWVLGQ